MKTPNRPFWEYQRHNSTLTAIVAVPRDKNTSRKHWVIGLGNNQIEALRAVHVSAEPEVDNFRLIILSKRIQDAFTEAAPGCYELRVEDPDWDILIQW
jgi:hypothetical protein